MSNIAEKIAKIIAKAGSTNSPQEAENLMAKVHELLEKHGLEMSDIATMNSEDPVGLTRKAHGHYASENWIKKLAYVTAQYFGCEGVLETEGKNHRWLAVAGRESARMTFQMMMPYLVNEVRRLAREGVKVGNFRTDSQGKTMIGNALTLRIWDLVKKERDSSVKRLGVTTANALVPMDQIKAAIHEVYGTLKEGRASTIKTTGAAVKAANGISLHKQTTATKASHRIGA